MDFKPWNGWTGELKLDTPYAINAIHTNGKTLVKCNEGAVAENFGIGHPDVFAVKLGNLEPYYRAIIYLSGPNLRSKIRMWRTLFKAGYGRDSLE